VINRLLQVQSFPNGILHAIEGPCGSHPSSPSHPHCPRPPHAPLNPYSNLPTILSTSPPLSTSFQFSRASISCVTPCVSIKYVGVSWRNRVLVTFVWPLAVAKWSRIELTDYWSRDIAVDVEVAARMYVKKIELVYLFKNTKIQARCGPGHMASATRIENR
jgi:hypothetical protein